MSDETPPEQPANPYPPYQTPYQGPYQAPAFPAQPAADLPKATAAMVVGIISLAGAVFCVLPILAAPVAWVLGAQARGQIRRAPQQWGGEGKATAGMVLGIVGTVLLVLGLVVLVIVIALLVNDPNFSDSDTRV